MVVLQWFSLDYVLVWILATFKEIAATFNSAHHTVVFVPAPICKFVCKFGCFPYGFMRLCSHCASS